MNNDTVGLLTGGFFLFFVVAVLIGIIVLAIVLVRKSSDRAKESEQNIAKMIANIPSDKQIVYMMQLNSAKKNPTVAVLLALFLGGIGIHKFYMNKVGLGILYLVFCWTYIPGIVALIEAFIIAGQVAEYNEQKAREILMMMGV